MGAGVAVGVGVSVAVGVDVTVAAGVLVAVAVGVAVAVALAVGVGVVAGAVAPRAMRPWRLPRVERLLMSGLFANQRDQTCVSGSKE